VNKLLQPFTAHPATVGENYFQHFLVSATFACRLFLAAFAAVLHALVPALCEHTVSREIARLHKKTSKRSPDA
jgi:hypothetical protein